jgi:hypothetical protein
MKRVADGGETVMAVPPVVKPVEVQVALRGVAPSRRIFGSARDLASSYSYDEDVITVAFQLRSGDTRFNLDWDRRQRDVNLYPHGFG